MPFDFFDKYVFLCEMYNEENAVVDLILNFFPYDHSVQLIDPKKGKNLVKRVQIDSLKLDMLQVGNVVAVFSKLIYIKDCAPLTGRQLFEHVESTFAMIKPSPPSIYGKVLTFIIKQGFRILRMRNGMLDKDIALALYESISNNSMMPVITEYVRSGEVVGMELSGPNAVKRFREVLGATDPKRAAPGTLRALFGQDVLKNVVHGCHSHSTAEKMINLYFGHENRHPRIPFRATLKNCTCCVIKPHVMFDGNLGHIIEMICTSNKFYISAMSMFMMSVANALEFYEVYNGVLPDYQLMAHHLAEGRCLALEVKAIDPNVNVVCEFRKLCGPIDPAVCRQLFPDSIRGLYGKNLIENAVHCTDLPEDGELECEYFFRILTCENIY